MLVISKQKVQMDSLLNTMAKEVQLDRTRYERMIVSYEAVKDWIESDEKFFKPYHYEVYPHGSVRIFTTVKPINKDEFDLDIVIHFKNNAGGHSPLRIYLELERRLKENKVYKKMMESKSRVIRLNYAGDFHMDIMPGVQANAYFVDQINVPDKSLGRWVSSNPKGYAKWFMDRANLAKRSLLERALTTEKIQADDFNNKKPLQRAVQLIKRYRDVFFENDSEFKTRSIILTTIAGQFYNGEESIFETVDNIITRIRNDFSYPSRIKVFNPVNPNEDFTDKWDEDHGYYEAFKKFVNHLFLEWQKLKADNGIISESRIFKGLFGENLVVRAQERESRDVDDLRSNGILGISTASGTLSTTAVSNSEKVQKNTFFGE